jgi:hypothetical protein
VRDITAVVLSIGEPYTDRAIASVQRQTLPVADTVVVRGVTPFHRALNQGAAQVRTPFFVQVDSDTILDERCLAQLRSCMDDHLGLVSCHLRDAIIWRIQGTRLYRTACFEHVQIRDSISPDMDFGIEIRRHGWGRFHVLRYGGDRQHWHTYGEHRPDYNPHYAFCKFRLEGIRSRYRRHEGRVRTLFHKLRTSTHPAAPIALIATAHGLFLHDNRDLLVPYERGPDFELLERFLAAAGETPPTAALAQTNGDQRRRFTSAYEWGLRCREAGASSAFLAQLHRLTRDDSLASWMTMAGMCHGLFHHNGNGAEAQQSYESLEEILAHGAPW